MTEKQLTIKRNKNVRKITLHKQTSDLKKITFSNAKQNETKDDRDCNFTTET